MVAAYGGVDGLVALEVGVLAQAVVSAAEDDARAAPRHEADVDGGQAAEEGVVPRLGGLGRLGVDVVAGAGQHVVEPRRPVAHVILVERLDRLLLLGSGHC